MSRWRIALRWLDRLSATLFIVGVSGALISATIHNSLLETIASLIIVFTLSGAAGSVTGVLLVFVWRRVLNYREARRRALLRLSDGRLS